MEATNKKTIVLKTQKSFYLRGILQLAILLLCVNLHSQEGKAEKEDKTEKERKDNKKAKELLNEVTAKIKSYENLEIKFEYSLVNSKEKINQKNKGDITLKNELYVLNFMNVTKMYDGKKTYTIVPEDEEITISKLEEGDEKAVTPSNIFTFFNSGYRCTMAESKNIKGRKIQYVKLNPNNPKDQRRKVLLGIDSESKQVYELIEVGKKGTRTTLTVVSFRTNIPLPKNFFTFTESKYPKYYINRLD